MSMSGRIESLEPQSFFAFCSCLLMLSHTARTMDDGDGPPAHQTDPARNLLYGKGVGKPSKSHERRHAANKRMRFMFDPPSPSGIWPTRYKPKSQGGSRHAANKRMHFIRRSI